MDLKDIKLKSVMYYMQSFVLTAGGKQFEVPNTMITGIEILKNYDTTIYPLWYVSVNVPNWFFSEMGKDPDNISVSMNLQYRLSDTTEGTVHPNGPLTTEISGNFKVVIEHTSQFADSALEKKYEKQNEAYGTNYTYNEYAIVELLLYDKAAYTASYKKINKVFTSINVTNAITYCFNQCGMGNILLSRSDNNQNYKEFKILPQPATKNMLRITEHYKFHKDGSVLFFDLDSGYLLSRKVGCHVWRTNEYKTTQIISLTERAEEFGRYSGVFINSKEKTNIICLERESFKSEIYNDSPQTRNTEQPNFLKFTTKQALISMLNPNKEYVVNIDSQDNAKYNGKYRIYSMSVKMVPSGDFLEPTFEVALRR